MYTISLNICLDGEKQNLEVGKLTEVEMISITISIALQLCNVTISVTRVYWKYNIILTLVYINILLQKLLITTYH